MKKLCGVIVLVAHLLTLTVCSMTGQSNGSSPLFGGVAIPMSATQQVQQPSTVHPGWWPIIARWGFIVGGAATYGAYAFRAKVKRERARSPHLPALAQAEKIYLNYTMLALTGCGVGLYAFNQWWKCA